MNTTMATVGADAATPIGGSALIHRANLGHQWGHRIETWCLGPYSYLSVGDTLLATPATNDAFPAFRRDDRAALRAAFLCLL